MKLKQIIKESVRQYINEIGFQDVEPVIVFVKEDTDYLKKGYYLTFKVRTDIDPYETPVQPNPKFWSSTSKGACEILKNKSNEWESWVKSDIRDLYEGSIEDVMDVVGVCKCSDGQCYIK